MIYNPTQLKKDLTKIMDVFGQWKNHVFFVTRECNLGDFTIVEGFDIPNSPDHVMKIYPPGKTFFLGDEKPVTEIHVDTWLGETILKKILWIEENPEKGMY